jgi:hypothetical protein
VKIPSILAVAAVTAALVATTHSAGADQTYPITATVHSTLKAPGFSPVQIVDGAFRGRLVLGGDRTIRGPIVLERGTAGKADDIQILEAGQTIRVRGDGRFTFSHERVETDAYGRRGRLAVDMVGRVTENGVQATYHASGTTRSDTGDASVIQVDATLRGPLRR